MPNQDERRVVKIGHAKVCGRRGRRPQRLETRDAGAGNARVCGRETRRPLTQFGGQPQSARSKARFSCVIGLTELYGSACFTVLSRGPI